jgi:hypothetical protein
MRSFKIWAGVILIVVNLTALAVLGWLHKDRLPSSIEFAGEWLYTDTTFDVVWKFNHDQSFEMYHTGIDVVSAGYWWKVSDNIIKIDTMPMGKTSTPLCYRYEVSNNTMFLVYDGPETCPGTERKEDSDYLILTRF